MTFFAEGSSMLHNNISFTAWALYPNLCACLLLFKLYVFSTGRFRDFNIAFC